MTEETIRFLIYIHAGFGLMALVIGLVAISVKKGHKLHKRAGKVFVVSMLISSLISIIVASHPGHHSVFLLCIGILTIYLVTTGYRCLSYHLLHKSLAIDYTLTICMLLCSIFLLLYVPIVAGTLHPLFTIFGLLGLSLSIQDLLLYRKREKLARGRLKMHIGKITGGYIASATAFVVVNSLIPGIYGWIAPGIFGSFYIIYWNRRLRNNSI